MISHCYGRRRIWKLAWGSVFSHSPVVYIVSINAPRMHKTMALIFLPRGCQVLAVKGLDLD